MTPTTKTANLYNLAQGIPVQSEAEGLKLFTVSEDDRHFVVSWNGHQFEANPVVVNSFSGTALYLSYDYTASDVAVKTAEVFHLSLIHI